MRKSIMVHEHTSKYNTIDCYCLVMMFWSMGLQLSFVFEYFIICMNKVLLILVLLNPDISCFENSVDPE